jgi:hypothetical protein
LTRTTTVVLTAIMTALATAALSSPATAQDSVAKSPKPPDVVCASTAGERQACAADTRGGVTLVQTFGPVACELGTTWGYDQKSIWVANGCRGAFTLGKTASTSFGTYTPMSGFKVVDTDQGDLSIFIYGYIRYLNQLGLDPSYTDAFGATVPVQQRQDIQLNKVVIHFVGWFATPKLRYDMYVWTQNVSLGALGSVIVAGNFNYAFNPHFIVGAAVASLPGVRSTEGNFPLWLTVDNRLISDEFFRPSYTTGIWVKGAIVDGLTYNVMLGNNLSQITIDASQLDNGLNTVAAAVVWMPTTHEYGLRGDFGDFEDHQKLATRFGAHYTYSQENYQGQPNNDNFENVQIRLSNGGVIFAPGLFGPGIWVQDARYQMMSLDAGLKVRGFALEGEYYTRWVDDFRGPGTAGLAALYDRGFQVQASAMAIPHVLQGYVSGSKVLGQYGNPSDLRFGVNWFPSRSQTIKWNAEYLLLDHSPVGALSLPYPVGGNGSVIYSSLQVNF